MALGSITDKGVDTHQPSLMGETGESSPIHMGVQNDIDISEQYKISTDPQWTCGHTGDRSAGGTMEVSGGHI